MSDVWSVTLPAWGTAVGTVGLAAFTYAVVRADRDANRKRDDLEMRSQARHVSVSLPTSQMSRGRDPDGHSFEVSSQFEVRNASDDAVNDVRIFVDLEPRDVLLDAVRVGTPSLPRMMPGDKQTVRVEAVVRGENGQLPNALRFCVSVNFTDSAGLRWRRDNDHMLHLIGREPRE